MGFHNKSHTIWWHNKTFWLSSDFDLIQLFKIMLNYLYRLNKLNDFVGIGMVHS